MTVSILGMTYKIFYRNNEEMDGELGKCVPSKLWIQINKDIPAPQQEETLMHEALHCISDELLLSLNEDKIQRLAVGLYSAGCRVKVEK